MDETKANWRCGHGWLRGEQCEICNAPKREWKGLTDEDWEHIDSKKGTALDSFAQGAVWAADQLKGRNR